MQKLIKTDLTGVLRMAGIYQPVNRGDVDRSVSALLRQPLTDSLFLSRRRRCRLSGLAAVYEPDTPDNLDWLACLGRAARPVIALYLHTDRIKDGAPWGSVTLLNSRNAAEDVRAVSALPEGQRALQIRRLIDRYQNHVRYCSVLEVIQYLKTGGESQWM